MYNLLVTASAGMWDQASVILQMGRFLEYAADPLKARLESLDAAAVDKLTQMPAVFMYESPVEQPARVGWIRKIQRRGTQIRISHEFDPNIAPIDPAALTALAGDLEIDGAEFDRTH